MCAGRHIDEKSSLRHGRVVIHFRGFLERYSRRITVVLLHRDLAEIYIGTLSQVVVEIREI